MRDRSLAAIIGSPAEVGVPYHALMPRKVSNLLLVSSLYDYYTFLEDGTLSEMLFSEYLDLDLRFTPSIERVSTAEEALERLRAESFDLVISMARVGEMNVREFGDAAKAIRSGVPVILLASSPRELAVLPPVQHLEGIDGLFVWLGDVRLFLAIIKHVEDRHNALHDAQVAGVRSIILVEDSVQFYSSYLPMLYGEILNQTRALTAESVTRAQRMSRMRARPKVLLARTYEEAERLYEQYQNNLLGVILDAAFPVGGREQPAAGFDFARLVRARTPDLPVLMQSDPRNGGLAASLGLPFIDKTSPRLLSQVRDFMQEHLGFGDFVFRRPDGVVISKAPDLRTLEWAIDTVPDDDLAQNIARNDFSAWLMARTEFELADQARAIIARTRQDGASLRPQLLQAVRNTRHRAMAGVVADYSTRTFEGARGVVRIGRGSLGGKARGLAFINSLIDTYHLEHRFPGVRIFVPPAAVLTTGVFDRFLESSGLLSYALEETDDEKITRAFLDAEIPSDVIENLWNFLQWVRYPLAVRSSSLLEDASYQPFAGIYKTHMIPNNDDDPEVRLEELCNAVKQVYASTYHADPKAYMQSLPNRLEEEKMAVVVQQMAGRRHGSYLYPDFAGVGRSMNFYPPPGMKPEDGIVSVALGLGKTVVDGGQCVRFCPAYPRSPIQSFTPSEWPGHAQRRFFALDVSKTRAASAADAGPSLDLASLDLSVAERDGTLGPVASVYSPDDDAVHDGLSRQGIRLVTMAGVLKGSAFPLAEVTAFLLQVAEAASSCPVEIEFAVTLCPDLSHDTSEFAFLQIRPLVFSREVEDVRLHTVDPRHAICISHKALGNGIVDDIRDVVFVRPETFERGSTPQIAREIGALNATLQAEKRRYILIGPGRWGSADPWLGIPVRWAHIAGVGCIVETSFEDIHVDPSQGSHFFQNLMSFGIGYLTVDRHAQDDFVDAPWLEGQLPHCETAHLRHLSFPRPLRIALDGRATFGIVMKPTE